VDLLPRHDRGVDLLTSAGAEEKIHAVREEQDGRQRNRAVNHFGGGYLPFRSIRTIDILENSVTDQESMSRQWRKNFGKESSR